MAEPTSYPEAGKDPDAEPGRGASSGRPRWQKVVGIVGLLVVLGLGLLLLAGGEHGPRRHAPGGDDAGLGASLPTASVPWDTTSGEQSGGPS